MANPTISDNIRDMVLQVLTWELRKRHLKAEYRLTAAETSRLCWSAAEWEHVVALLRLRGTVCFRPAVTLAARTDFEHIGFRTDMRLVLPQKTGGPASDFGVRSDNPVFERWSIWGAANSVIAGENLLLYNLADALTDRCSTWKQVAKAWPELAMLLERARKHRPTLMDGLVTLDTTGKGAARTPPGVEHITTGIRAAREVNTKTLIECSMLPEPIDTITINRSTGTWVSEHAIPNCPTYSMGPGISNYGFFPYQIA